MAQSAKLSDSQRDSRAQKAGHSQFDPSVDPWFDTSIFPTQAQAPFTLRNFPTRFPDVRSKPLNNVEFSASKEIPIRERLRWQIRADFHNGAYTDDDIADVFTQRISTPLHIYKNVFIPNGLYHFARHQLTYGSGKERRFTYNFFERFGGYYGGTLNEFRVRANYRPTAKFSISASETWDRFRLPLPNGNFSVVLASLQGNYSFTRFLTFTSLIQVDTSNTQAVSANVRLRYNYRPDSDLYIIYNVGTQFASIAPANPPQVRETRFAIKYTYSWQR